MKLTLSGYIGLVALGCGPKVTAFSVSPSRICATDTVIVRTGTKDEGELRIMPRRVGTTTDTVRYVFVASKKGKLDQRAADVLIYKGGDLDTLVLGPTRKHGTDSVRVQDTLRVAFWPSFILLGELRSASGRPIAISHNGRTAVALPNQSTAALSGLPVMGEWDIRAPLIAGEQFGIPGGAPPGQLLLQATIRCEHPGGTP